MITAETCRSISYPLPIKLNENYTTFLKNSNCHKHFQQNLYCLRCLDDVKYQQLSLNSKFQHHVQYLNFSSKPLKRKKFHHLDTSLFQHSVDGLVLKLYLLCNHQTRNLEADGLLGLQTRTKITIVERRNFNKTSLSFRRTSPMGAV